LIRKRNNLFIEGDFEGAKKIREELGLGMKDGFIQSTI